MSRFNYSRKNDSVHERFGCCRQQCKVSSSMASISNRQNLLLHCCSHHLKISRRFLCIALCSSSFEELERMRDNSVIELGFHRCVSFSRKFQSCLRIKFHIVYCEGGQRYMRLL